MTRTAPIDSLEAFRDRADAWLAARLNRRPYGAAQVHWGQGSDDVSVFHALSPQEEAELIASAAGWQREKVASGYGAVAWPVEYGGGGLSVEYERVFREVEAEYETPPDHELRRVTVNLVAPTVRDFGSDQQRERLLMLLLKCEQLACQLFSEPGAGSDLAAVATRATMDGNDWIVSGSKVWASGAQFAQWGELVARTNTDVPKHEGLTVFLMPLDLPGVEVRPIRQMSGGTSFNEVFLSNVRVPDRHRLGPVDAGWKVALATLGYERGQSGAKKGVGGSWDHLLALARWAGRANDPLARQTLARIYTHERLRELTRLRLGAAANRTGVPGPEGSIGKLMWVEGMTMISDSASEILGPRLVADTGEWGTYAWSRHILGAPGFRIAGGTDEIQRNIIAERSLGLPREPAAHTRQSLHDTPR